MTEIYIDGDACPVRDETYRVAGRFKIGVYVVSNGSRPIRPVADPNIRMIVVSEGADAADDWIAEHITAADVCITADIPLASRCLAKSARAVSPNGKHWTQDNIGSALAGREIGRHLREMGVMTGGGASVLQIGPITLSCGARYGGHGGFADLENLTRCGHAVRAL